MAWAQAANAAKSIEADAIMRAIETTQFNSPRGPFRFGKYDHEAEVPVFVGKLEQSKEFGQPVVVIEDVISPQLTRPSESVVQKMRHE